LIFSTISLVNIHAQSQSGVDSTGLPGDNFSLQGALELFKKSSSPEEFEKLINTESNHVNNLDLNEDGEIDYIRVIDNADGDAHAIVLQAIVSEKESQDIAVIEIEKTGTDNAVLQIVGDEDIYGEEIIVEPENDSNAIIENYNGFTVHGPSVMENTYKPLLVVNVWVWPSVRFVYTPGYAVWRSPYRWRTYPIGWRPWRPLRWHMYYPFVRPYHSHFTVVTTRRVVAAHKIYTPVRVSSVTVRTRHATAVGNYRVTHLRTVVTGPRGNKAVRKSTTVKGPRGNKVKTSRTKVRRR